MRKPGQLLYHHRACGVSALLPALLLLFFSLFLLSQEQTQHNNKKKRERETSNSNDEVTVSRGLGGDKSRRKCTLRLVE